MHKFYLIWIRRIYWKLLVVMIASLIFTYFFCRLFGRHDIAFAIINTGLAMIALGAVLIAFAGNFDWLVGLPYSRQSILIWNTILNLTVAITFAIYFAASIAIATTASKNPIYSSETKIEKHSEQDKVSETKEADDDSTIIALALAMGPLYVLGLMSVLRVRAQQVRNPMLTWLRHRDRAVRLRRRLLLAAYVVILSFLIFTPSALRPGWTPDLIFFMVAFGWTWQFLESLPGNYGLSSRWRKRLTVGAYSLCSIYAAFILYFIHR